MIYVDKLQFGLPKNTRVIAVGRQSGQMWCHLWANDPEELLQFGLKIGLKEHWLQKKTTLIHFDLVPKLREKALWNGAVETSLKDWLKKKMKNDRL